MSNYSLSYNFPDGFLWGTSIDGNDLLDRKNYAYLYQMQELKIPAAAITLKWSDYEPLKNNYNEPMIEASRNLFSRLLNQNIEPILILDISEIPNWQNLEKTHSNSSFSDERFNFSTYIANALVPYTKYFGLYCSNASVYSSKLLNAELTVHQDIRKYIQSISAQVKVGAIIPGDIFTKKHGGLLNLFRQVQLDALKNADLDFIGINAKKEIRTALHTSFNELRMPLLVYSDNIRSIPPEQRHETLIDDVYGIWHFYQQGWPFIGFFSEIDIESESPERRAFINLYSQNALELSTQMTDLPEKWIRFLKD